ncbi:MAG: SEC-C metal-binding domain-containing protein [Bacteroidia bacterium]|nr:SEC-C metal-binding domain-containing protein [Bacteroidia bacterium]
MNQEVRSYFVRFTKDELSTILSYFGQDIPSKAKKAELVDIVSEFIGGHPREWLYKLPERDLRLLQTIVVAGMDNWVKMESPEYPSVASILGLIYVDDNSFDDIMASMDYALYYSVSSIVSQVIKEKEADGSFAVERIALGLLNIYGAIPVEDFVETVFDMFDDEGDGGKEVTLAMADCPMVAMNRVYYKDKVYVISPYAYDYESIIDGREDFEEINDFKLYSILEATSAGAGAPFCAFRNAGCEAVEDILRSIGYTEGEIREEIHKIWFNAQFAVNDSSAEAIFSSINSRIDDLESFDEYRKCVDIIAAYANSVPKWMLNGYTSDEIGQLQLSIKVDESVMEGHGLEEEAEMDEKLGPLKDYYKYNMAVHHVAADEPCPCGSGLSYCHCHGKRMN